MIASGIKPCVFRIARPAAVVALGAFFKVHACGLDHLPSKGPFLLMAKHQRWEDIPLLGLSAPRPLYYIAKHELFANPFFRWFLISLGGIPLNRDYPLRSRGSLRMMIRLLGKGEGMVIFPEGTYYPGRMGAGRLGVVRMVFSRLHVPFVPVGIRYERGKARTLVRIRYGRPVLNRGFGDFGAFFREIMSQIAILSDLPFPPT